MEIEAIKSVERTKNTMQLHPFMVGLHVCHLQLQEHHVLCAFLLARRTPRPGRAVKPTSGHRWSHDFSCFVPSVSKFWSSISSSLHFHDCSSWISWACRNKRSNFFHKMWSQCFLEILYSSPVWLSHFRSVKQSFENRLLAFKRISKCGRPFFRFQFFGVVTRETLVRLASEPRPWNLSFWRDRWSKATATQP